jgi:hypothetical protein
LERTTQNHAATIDAMSNIRKNTTGKRGNAGRAPKPVKKAGVTSKRGASAKPVTSPTRKPRTKRPQAKPRVMGRPVTLTPEIRGRIAELVAVGMRPTPAAASLGIAPQTLSSWRKTMPDFERELEQADAIYLRKLLADSDRIVSNEDNLSAAGAQLRFLMERRFPSEYGPKNPDVTVNTNINAPLVLSAAQLEAIQAKRREGLKR